MLTAGLGRVGAAMLTDTAAGLVRVRAGQLSSQLAASGGLEL